MAKPIRETIMKKSDHLQEGVAERDGDIIDLGAASEETRGPVQPIVFEAFAYLPDSGIAKD